MVTLNVVQRLRHSNDLRSYRRKLSGDIHQSAMLRLLPALLDVPLPIVGTDTAPRHLDDTLEQAGYVVLAGAHGSGRTLALHQLARQWLADDDAPIPAFLSLPRIDDGLGGNKTSIRGDDQRACCASRSAPGGRAVSAFSVRCMRQKRIIHPEQGIALQGVRRACRGG